MGSHPTCVECEWFSTYSGKRDFGDRKTFGYCYAEPPAMFYDQDSHKPFGHRPTVMASDMACGKFELKGDGFDD